MQNLRKEFRGFIAVDNVSLQVIRGHIHALIGGLGTFTGPVLRAIIIGLIFVICVTAFRRGVGGELLNACQKKAS
jgi:ABC-type uncharacterized transport system ATPase subunit